MRTSTNTTIITTMTRMATSMSAATTIMTTMMMTMSTSTIMSMASIAATMTTTNTITTMTTMHDHDEHHHEHGEHCCCGHHHHHHDHDADEIFTSWGKETAHKYSREDLDSALEKLDSCAYGMILRAKGIVDGGDTWYEFDMVPGEHEIRACGPDVTGKLCVIGSDLKEHEIAALFHV